MQTMRWTKNRLFFELTTIEKKNAQHTKSRLQYILCELNFKTLCSAKGPYTNHVATKGGRGGGSSNNHNTT